MKTLLKVLLALGVGGAALVAFVFWLTAGLPKTADQFFTHVAQGKYDEAMAMTTPDFKASTDRAALEAFAKENGLAGYESASWSSRSVENNVGLLKGSLSTKGGGVIPVTVNLVKGDDGWRVQNVRKSDAGVDIDLPAGTEAPPAVKEAPPAPDAAAQTRLIKESLQAFAEAVNADDFTSFHQGVAGRLQAQMSAEEMRTAFATFIEQQVDLTVLDALDPTIDPSSGIDADGSLHLTGSYDTQPSGTGYDLRYELENDTWRLININVRVN